MANVREHRASKRLMRLRYETEQWLPQPVPVVFAFFANPANLPPLMPAWQQARIEDVALRPAPPSPQGGSEALAFSSIAAGDATEILITARALPFLPLRGAWLARIEDFRWNEGFCDVQVKGPFRYWRHCHSVDAAPSSGNTSEVGTRVRDEVEFELPLGANVSFLNRLVLQQGFARLFRYRQAQAKRLLAIKSGIGTHEKSIFTLAH